MGLVLVKSRRKPRSNEFFPRSMSHKFDVTPLDGAFHHTPYENIFPVLDVITVTPSSYFESMGMFLSGCRVPSRSRKSHLILA